MKEVERRGRNGQRSEVGLQVSMGAGKGRKKKKREKGASAPL